MGEVSGAKIAGALELAVEDNRNGIPTRAVIVFETGGVRLQEANLGLAAIAEIHAGIHALRAYGPVIGITAGVVGCFGGMSIAAGLCSYLLMTREARLGLNGPQVIEQEAGIEEYDSRDRPRRARPLRSREPSMSQTELSTRGATWMRALTANFSGRKPVAGYGSTLQVVDATLADRPTRYIAVVPDAANRFPRARSGEVGLIEGWQLARAVRDAMTEDAGRDQKRAIVAVIDVASQAYGRREEAYGIHLALAAAADAYAAARLAGHPVIGLIVGRAMSGALLAHGYQANRLIALDDAEVMVHAMGKAAAARVTLRSVADLERLAQEIPPMAYDIASFASLGLLWRLLKVKDAQTPDASDIDTVQTALATALADIAADPSRGLESRLGAPLRQASSQVRARLRAQWNAQTEGA
jgi:malonate decarboxylase gamma subunit